MTSPLFQDHFFNPRNAGNLEEDSYQGRAGSLSCGAAIRVSIAVDESQTISAIRFKAAGCSVLVATASLLTDSVLGRTTAETAELARHADLVSQSFDPDVAGCGTLVGEALISAIKDYSDAIRERSRDEWSGDESLICTCFCVSERTIETEIQKGHLSTVVEVTRACNAGGGCRSCWPLIEDMLAMERTAR